jgi:hypothetical protein
VIFPFWCLWEQSLDESFLLEVWNSLIKCLSKDLLLDHRTIPMSKTLQSHLSTLFNHYFIVSFSKHSLLLSWVSQLTESLWLQSYHLIVAHGSHCLDYYSMSFESGEGEVFGQEFLYLRHLLYFSYVHLCS